jgi:hypothetical protein
MPRRCSKQPGARQRDLGGPDASSYYPLDLFDLWWSYQRPQNYPVPTVLEGKLAATRRSLVGERLSGRRPSCLLDLDQGSKQRRLRTAQRRIHPHHRLSPCRCLRNDGPQSTYTVKDATYIRFGHLFAAPRAANTHDAASKHRLPTGPCHWTKTHPELLPRGQRKGSNKLTDEDVRVIRREYASHAISQKALSQRYHVDPAVISRIVRHMIWRHVT